uniref:Uncharacterized protein n=1 Tax=Meloidogyne enterolobii TaxID=390850 RepID=A0A6V7UMY8_MELEN|nr:unnamed protein product [Meloidogyne enterolobii]
MLHLQTKICKVLSEEMWFKTNKKNKNTYVLHFTSNNASKFLPFTATQAKILRHLLS